MGTINPDLSGIVDGEVADASDFTTPINTITDEINGSIDNDNIKAAAGIVQSKITTTTLGYAEITADFTTATEDADVDVTGLTTTVTVPTGGRRIKVTAYCGQFSTSAATGTDLYWKIKEGTTTLAYSIKDATQNYVESAVSFYVTAATAGSHTYKVAVFQSDAGTATVAAKSTQPAFILVELI